METRRFFIDKIIDNLSTKHNFTFYAAFLRIFICLYLIKDVIITMQFKDLFYKGKMYLETGNSVLLDVLGVSTQFVRDNFEIFNGIYLILIVLYFFGVGKNLIALFLCMFYEVIQNFTWITLNGGDNLMKFVMLYMVFINSYEYFSIDKQRFKNRKNTAFNNFMTNLGCYSICIHLCLVYFVSAMHKIHADVWFNGIATYYTLSLERFGGGNAINEWLSKNGTFVTLSTYGTILVELFYPVLIWFKETKVLFIISAIGLHLSIAVLMMLYDFQLLFIALQGMFISDKFWISLVEKVKSKPFIQKMFFDDKKEELIS
ncbi:HTTM domain-containing protein [Tenacibaculum sp. 190524A02b]|uniref:HTTM domain-containing protein n=1 Tax=Tenacibaculum vairaonense TaxID=3137860 RepID=UPI0032B29766